MSIHHHYQHKNLEKDNLRRNSQTNKAKNVKIFYSKSKDKEMKEYFVIFILFTIFILYSVTLISNDLNRMRCVEGFEAPAATFLEAIQGAACSTIQRMHYYTSSATDGTYQLTCHDQCSTSNTSVPVSSGASNCKLPSDSNCEVNVNTKCYLDGAFYEASSNVNMNCPDSGYADCASCSNENEGTCSNIGDSCERTDTVTLPTGYARCTLTSNLDNLTYLDTQSNVRFACDTNRCTASGSTGGPDPPRLIASGSCSTLDCYGDASFHGGRFNIQDKVLGIKIPIETGIIKTQTNSDGTTIDYKYVTLNFNRSGNTEMSIGICKNTDKLMNPLSSGIITGIKTYYEKNHEIDSETPQWIGYKGPERLTNDYKATLDQDDYIIDDMIEDPSSTEMVCLGGGGHGGVYFNYIKEGNTFSDFWMTDHITGKGNSEFWTKYSPGTRVRFEFKKNMTSVKVLNRDGGAMTYNANVSFLTNDNNINDNKIGEHYIFLKGGPYTPLHISNLSFS